jgi:hypothetical protein
VGIERHHITDCNRICVATGCTVRFVDYDEHHLGCKVRYLAKIVDKGLRSKVENAFSAPLDQMKCERVNTFRDCSTVSSLLAMLSGRLSRGQSTLPRHLRECRRSGAKLQSAVLRAALWVRERQFSR